MTELLKLLEPQARGLLNSAFMDGSGVLDLKQFINDYSRKLDLEPFRNIVERAMSDFENSRESSDSWLAPRIHATVRLTRREAADTRLWDYLSIIIAPDYVRWRWQGKDNGIVNSNRFAGPEYKQAFARLWWGAEMTRNGNDYTWTKVLFANQDFQNSWARLDLFHHRSASIAAAKYLSTFNNGKMATSDQIRQLARGFNMVMTTTMLDAIADNPEIDVVAVREWCNETVDDTLMFIDDPTGPSDSPVPEGSVDAVIELLKHATKVTTFFKRKRSKDIANLLKTEEKLVAN